MLPQQQPIEDMARMYSAMEEARLRAKYPALAAHLDHVFYIWPETAQTGPFFVRNRNDPNYDGEISDDRAVVEDARDAAIICALLARERHDNLP